MWQPSWQPHRGSPGPRGEFRSRLLSHGREVPPFEPSLTHDAKLRDGEPDFLQLIFQLNGGKAWGKKVTEGHSPQEGRRLLESAKFAAIRGFLRVPQASGNETVP
jgi:hypothetical protein